MKNYAWKVCVKEDTAVIIPEASYYTFGVEGHLEFMLRNGSMVDRVAVFHKDHWREVYRGEEVK